MKTVKAGKTFLMAQKVLLSATISFFPFRSVTNPVKEDKDIKVIDEGISKDEDRARVSRLFYLQLYSSVLSNENNKISNRPMSPLSKSPAEMNLQNDPQEVRKFFKLSNMIFITLKTKNSPTMIIN